MPQPGPWSVRRGAHRRRPEKCGGSSYGGGGGGGRRRDRREDGSRGEQFADSESEIWRPFSLQHPTIQRISPLMSLMRNKERQ